MQLGGTRLSPSERQRRFASDACLYCGQTGHFIAKRPGSSAEVGVLASIVSACGALSPLILQGTLLWGNSSLPVPFLVDSDPFAWPKEAEDAFAHLKVLFTTAPVIQIPCGSSWWRWTPGLGPRCSNGVPKT